MTRLVVSFLILSIIPLAIVGYLAYNSGHNAAVHNIEAHLESVATLKEQEVNNWVEGLANTLTYLASDPERNSNVAVLASHAVTDPEYLAAHDYLVAEFKRIAAFAEMPEVFLLDSTSGQIIASSDENWEGRFRENEAYFLEGKSNTYVSDMFHSLSLGRPTMVISTPVRDSGGQLIGVLAGHANLEDLSEVMLERSGLGETGDTYLVNSNNLLLTETHLEPGLTFNKWIFTDGVSRALEGESGVGLYTDYREVPVIGAYTWMDDMKLALIAEQDQSEAFASVNDMRNNILLTALAVLLIAAGLSVVFARRITAGQRRAEERTEHLNTMLRAIRNVNQLIVREKDSRRLIKGACDELVATRGYFNVWIALVNEFCSLVAIAEAGLGNNFKPMVEMLKRGEMPSCEQNALKQSGVIITEDPLSTCTDCPLSQMYGGRRGMTARLEHEGKVYGVMSVSIPGDPNVDEEEHTLFLEVVEDIAFALYNMEMEEGRKQAEEELRESEKKHRNLFEGASDGIFTMELTGEDAFFTDCNSKVLTMFGCNLEEVIGKSPLDFSPPVQPDGRPSEEKVKELADAVMAGEPQSFEWVHRRLDGTTFEVEVTLNRIDVGGKIYLQAIVRDVTERKQAEEALRESEEKYRTVLETMDEAYYEVDLTGNLTFFNDSMCRIIGYPPDELMGMNNRQYMDDETAKAVYEVFNRVYQTEEPDRAFGWHAIRKDDVGIFVEASVSLMRGPSGEPVGFRGVLRDITEHRRAEEEKLQAITERAAIIDSMGDGLITIDMDGKILSVNPAFERLSGFPEDKFKDKDVASLIPRFIKPEDQETLSANVGASLKGNTSENAIFSLISRDGQEIIIYVTASFIPDAEGKPAIIIAIFKDITDIKRAEEELKNHRDHLEELVEERTRHLEEKSRELSEINVLLEEASRHKSEFLANMSHELRTPLNSIIGYTKLILDGVEGEIKEEQRKDLEIVHSNSQHLLQMIGDLLDISKIEAGRVELQWREFGLSDLLSEVIIPMQRLAEEKGLTLAYDVAAGIDKLYGDKGRVRQVLLNILGNAVKFTGEGGIDLRVSENETDFIFSVTDTGIGIGEDDLEIIFDSFEQVGPAQIAGYEGTGLGLTISKQFVEMHGGMMQAKSEPGKGSTFTFTLPKKGSD